MTEKTYTQKDMDSVVNPQVINELLDLRGLADDQVAEGRRRIEAKHGLTPGILGSANLSSVVEAERQKIYPAHYEASMDEVSRMTPDEYARWRDLGAHVKKTPEEIQLDAEQEERDRARAEENELTAKMTMPEYVAYREQKELEAKQKAEQEAAEVARVAREEQQKKVDDLRGRDPSEMTMAEYLAWRNK